MSHHNSGDRYEYKRVRGQVFVSPYQFHSLLSTYNSLTDKHLTAYFNNSRIRRHLQRVGLITRSGRIVPDKEYRYKVLQRAHQRHVRECLAQAIFHKVLDMERLHQIEIKRKLEEFARRERVYKIKVERSRRYEDEPILMLSPRPPMGPKGSRTRHSGPEVDHSESTDTPGSSRPNSAPGKMQRPVRLKPIHSTSTTASLKRTTPGSRPRDSSDDRDQVLSRSLDHDTRRHLTTADYSNAISPYRLPVINNYVTPVPPLTKKKGGAVKVTPNGTLRGRRLRPTTAPGGAADAEEPVLQRSSMQSKVIVRMVYFGKSVHLSHDLMDLRDEVKVFQQHCGGENLCVYKGRLREGETFQFVSRRHRGFPFSLTFFLNGLQVDRLSSCCEFKHRRGSRLGGRHGHFGFTGAENASPCYKCIIAMGLDKKPTPPPKRVREDTGSDKPASRSSEGSKEGAEVEEEATEKDPPPEPSQPQNMETDIKEDTPHEDKPKDDYEEDFEADDEGPVEDGADVNEKSPSPTNKGEEKELRTEEENADAKNNRDSDSENENEDKAEVRRTPSVSSGRSSSSLAGDDEAGDSEHDAEDIDEAAAVPEESPHAMPEGNVSMATAENDPKAAETEDAKSSSPPPPQASGAEDGDPGTQQSAGDGEERTEPETSDTTEREDTLDQDGAVKGTVPDPTETRDEATEDKPQRAKSVQEKLAEAMKEVPCSSEPELSDTSTEEEEDTTDKSHHHDDTGEETNAVAVTLPLLSSANEEPCAEPAPNAQERTDAVVAVEDTEEKEELKESETETGDAIEQDTEEPCVESVEKVEEVRSSSGMEGNKEEETEGGADGDEEKDMEEPEESQTEELPPGTGTSDTVEEEETKQQEQVETTEEQEDKPTDDTPKSGSKEEDEDNQEAGDSKEDESLAQESEKEEENTEMETTEEQTVDQSILATDVAVLETENPTGTSAGDTEMEQTADENTEGEGKALTKDEAMDVNCEEDQSVEDTIKDEEKEIQEDNVEVGDSDKAEDEDTTHLKDDVEEGKDAETEENSKEDKVEDKEGEDNQEEEEKETGEDGRGKDENVENGSSEEHSRVGEKEDITASNGKYGEISLGDSQGAEERENADDQGQEGVISCEDEKGKEDIGQKEDQDEDGQRSVDGKDTAENNKEEDEVLEGGQKCTEEDENMDEGERESEGKGKDDGNSETEPKLVDGKMEDGVGEFKEVCMDKNEEEKIKDKETDSIQQNNEGEKEQDDVRINGDDCNEDEAESHMNGGIEAMKEQEHEEDTTKGEAVIRMDEDCGNVTKITDDDAVIRDAELASYGLACQLGVTEPHIKGDPESTTETALQATEIDAENGETETCNQEDDEEPSEKLEALSNEHDVTNEKNTEPETTESVESVKDAERENCTQENKDTGETRFEELSQTVPTKEASQVDEDQEGQTSKEEETSEKCDELRASKDTDIGKAGSISSGNDESDQEPLDPKSSVTGSSNQGKVANKSADEDLIASSGAAEYVSIDIEGKETETGEKAGQLKRAMKETRTSANNDSSTSTSTHSQESQPVDKLLALKKGDRDSVLNEEEPSPKHTTGPPVRGNEADLVTNWVNIHQASRYFQTFIEPMDDIKGVSAVEADDKVIAGVQDTAESPLRDKLSESGDLGKTSEAAIGEDMNLPLSSIVNANTEDAEMESLNTKTNVEPLELDARSVNSIDDTPRSSKYPVEGMKDAASEDLRGTAETNHSNEGASSPEQFSTAKAIESNPEVPSPTTEDDQTPSSDEVINLAVSSEIKHESTGASELTEPTNVEDLSRNTTDETCPKDGSVSKGQETIAEEVTYLTSLSLKADETEEALDSSKPNLPSQPADVEEKSEPIEHHSTAVTTAEIKNQDDRQHDDSSSTDKRQRTNSETYFKHTRSRDRLSTFSLDDSRLFGPATHPRLTIAQTE